MRCVHVFSRRPGVNRQAGALTSRRSPFSLVCPKSSSLSALRKGQFLDVALPSHQRHRRTSMPRPAFLRKWAQNHSSGPWKKRLVSILSLGEEHTTRHHLLHLLNTGSRSAFRPKGPPRPTGSSVPSRTWERYWNVGECVPFQNPLRHSRPCIWMAPLMFVHWIRVPGALLSPWPHIRFMRRPGPISYMGPVVISTSRHRRMKNLTMGGPSACVEAYSTRGRHQGSHTRSSSKQQGCLDFGQCTWEV